MRGGVAINIRYFPLPDALQPYFTALYSFSVDCDDEVVVNDMLHPEWAAMRFTQSGEPPLAAVVPEPMRPTWRFVGTGPTSKAINFGLRRSTIWGLGLKPLGWARYVKVPACDLADTIFDAGRNPAFAIFAPLVEAIGAGDRDPGETVERVIACLQAIEASPAPGEDQIMVCHEALRDPEAADVGHCAEMLGIGRRTLERLCRRHFGFAPKMLLRRQRFLRSLGRFMLKPKRTWSKALDGQYFDQAHFVREFRSFMGMTPSEYADRPHPILDRIITQHIVDQGAELEIDLPTVLRYGT